MVKKGSAVIPVGRAVPVMVAGSDRPGRNGSVNDGGEGYPIRLRDIPRLSRQEFIQLACRAAEASLGRLRDIARNADPADGPLLRLLERITSEKEDQARLLRDVNRAEPESGRRLNEAVLNLTLREHFISHICPFGEGFLNRDAALYFAESSTQELSRFFHLMSDRASDEIMSVTLKEIAEDEAARLEYIRTVILADADELQSP